MIIYIDSDYKCHVAEAEGTRAFDAPAFDGKCQAFIEGYRYIPEGETWERGDGAVFNGEMLSPFVDSRILDAYQTQYEANLAELEDMKAALMKMGVTANG
jgi:hypothetical protein